MALEQELSFTLTPDELDRALRYAGLEHLGLGVLANAILTLDFDNLRVYALHGSDAIQFTYTKRSGTVEPVGSLYPGTDFRVDD